MHTDAANRAVGASRGRVDPAKIPPTVAVTNTFRMVALERERSDL
jgi:hypothetical protein